MVGATLLAYLAGGLLIWFATNFTAACDLHHRQGILNEVIICSAPERLVKRKKISKSGNKPQRH
jgi:hypothetical protein